MLSRFPSRRPERAFRLSTLFAILVLCACGCTATNPLAENKSSLVRCRIVGSGKPSTTLELILINKFHPECNALVEKYSSRASVKRVPPGIFETLLEEMNDLGFFETAVERGGWSPDSEKAKRVISAETPHRKWVLAWTANKHKNFYDLVNVIRNCHDSVLTIQVIDNPKGAGLFLEQKNRLNKKGIKRKER